MKKKLLLGVIVVVCLCGSAALALDPMGPPTAGLKKGKFSAAFEYSYSDMTVKRRTRPRRDTNMEMEIHKYYANLGYGLTDNWEAFLRLGGADMDYGRGGDYGSWKGDDTAFSIGFGTKVTLWESSNPCLKLGALAQVSWADFDGKRTNPHPESEENVGTFDTDFAEYQIAAGATYKLLDNVSIYGGPFWHFVDGEHYQWHDENSRTLDIYQGSIWGGYVGGQVDINENLAFNIEYQGTGDAESFATGLICRF